MTTIIEEMQRAECDTKLRSDSIQCFKRIKGAPKRVCAKCFEKPRKEKENSKAVYK